MRTYRYGNQYKKVKKSYALEASMTFLLTFYIGMLFLKNVAFAVTPDQLYLETLEFGKYPALNVYVETSIAGTSAELFKPASVPNIVQYIAEKWQKHGTGEVVKAINCFYSESGLRPTAVNQNTDAPKSKDYGVAQLNGYWHNLSELEKTNFIANIDRAYKIYMGRGKSWSAWYGKGCK